jgi:hypothetical protein
LWTNEKARTPLATGLAHFKTMYLNNTVNMMAQKDETMKSILQLVKNSIPTKERQQHNNDSETKNSESEATTPEPLTNIAVFFIWSQMSYIYGDKWIGISGTSVDDIGNLTPKALSWQKWLSGITSQQLKNAFKLLVLEGNQWPPTLPEFRKLCLSRNFEDIPTVDDVYKILAFNKGKEGSVKDRYQHPLVFRISELVDLSMVRGAIPKIAMPLITNVYDRLLKSGWPDWKPEHLFKPNLIENKPTEVNKQIGRKSFSEIRKSL